MEKKEAKVKTTMDLAQAISYLSDIVASLKAGTVSVSNGEHAMTLVPPRTVKVELEAVQKDDRESISMEISWRKEEPMNGSTPLRISADPIMPSNPSL